MLLVDGEGLVLRRVMTAQKLKKLKIGIDTIFSALESTVETRFALLLLSAAEA